MAPAARAQKLADWYALNPRNEQAVTYLLARHAAQEGGTARRSGFITALYRRVDSSPDPRLSTHRVDALLKMRDSETPPTREDPA